MEDLRKLIRKMFALVVVAFIPQKSANIFGAAICSSPCLLLSNTTDIIALDYKTSATHSVVSGLTRAIAVDVHFSLGYIFWSDVSERNIKRSSTDGSGLTTIISGIGVCDGLAVEWRTSQLYWTDSTSDTISVSDLSGNNQRSLLSLGLDEPRDIALDLDSGVMFWTDWGSAPKIEKATLTGSQRVAIVTSNLQWPNGMELDKGNKRIYWVDGGTDRIESVNYQGNKRILLSKVTGFHAFGVAMISPFLFFTDWASGGVLHKLDAETGNHIVSNYKTTGRLMGIVAYDQSRQPPVSNQCTVNNGGCSHFCVVTSSSHLCVCPTGFALKQDGRTCENKVKKFFLFNDADDKSTNIISLDVNYFAAKTLFSHLGRPIALDFDPVEDRVYWTDVGQGLILSAFSNATALKILFRCNVNVPDGIAIDKVGRNIYWSDTGNNRIEVARLDGAKRKLLIKDGLDEPRAIVLDERNGTMYWTDWGSNPKIEQAAMDGSCRRSVITGNLGWPNGLTIDRSTNLLYWADAKLDKIEVSDLTGANRRLVMSSTADIHPFGLTLYQGMLYWTDWKHQSISRLDLSNGNKKMIITGLKKPMDIHLYDSSVTISGPHPCAINRRLCSDLCLLKPYGGYQCACPTGIFLKPDGRTCDYVMYNKKSSDHFMLFAEASAGEIYKVPLDITDTPCEPLAIRDNISRPVAVDYDSVEGKVYWTDVTLKQIARSYPNGSDLEVLASHNVTNPDGIAIDWIGRNLYWTDAGTNRIEVSRLDGSFRTSLITANVDLPRAIILDIEARKMYWSDWGFSPKIEKSNMDGTDRTTIVSSGLMWVNSLALDFKKKLLYWCDARLDLIERVDLQGNNRVVVLNLPKYHHHPFGLALYQDALFWTDWSTQSVHKYNMTSTTSEVFLYGMSRPMEIHMYDYNTITTGTTNCSHLNGGCSHICLPNPTGHRCFCPEGVPLKPGDQFTCQVAIRCAALPTPPNGWKAGCSDPSSEQYGTICSFSCKVGYNLTGSSKRQCLENENWSGIDSICRDVEAPVIDPCPRDIKVISKEKVPKLILPGVKVTDNVRVVDFATSIRNGSKVKFGRHHITYTASDKAGNVAYCRFRVTITASKCKDLPVPRNGGKACGVVQKEMICTVHCNPGYGFANFPAPIYRCDNSGQWFIVHGSTSLPIMPTLPDCSKKHIPKTAWFRGQYHYLTNNCNESLTDKIVDNFKDLLLQSVWGLHRCHSTPDCENVAVDVDCGEQTRRKRDTAALLPLSVNFALKVRLSNYSSNTLLDLNETSLQISNDILAALEPAASVNITGVVIVVDTTRPPVIQLTSFICEDGQVLIGTKCVNCPVGYFFNGSSCQACAVDEYQDQEAQTFCISCPSRTSTFGQQGSKERHNCQDLLIPTSDNEQHGMPKIKLVSIILGAALVVVLIVLGIWGARKYCRRGPTMDRAVVGFSNNAYDNTVEWEELKIKSSNA
ncbi:low-density lipoprotein receptor-related protein 4-like isoform X2 [Acropora millepora]|uniref:low-density lipoprotein receptor-related protein 4-like isoform X2 n=1 Tax=Acropora millepora TaxID=45264 RepID=UPI001CF176D1|nr:low-density lipoprotein receptor-related protein 4-like isoform X2 [Acropora millepora]